jgi:hypothetical protein
MLLPEPTQFSPLALVPAPLPLVQELLLAWRRLSALLPF